MALFDLLLGEDDGVYDDLYKNLLKQRVIYFNDVVTDELVDRVTMPIVLMNEQEKHVPTKELKPITIYMNSDGGDVIPTMHLIDVIKKSRIPIHVRVLSKACSSGLLITVACHRRFGSKDSVFLLHDGQLALQGSSGKARDTMDFLDAIEERMDKVVLENTNLSEEEYLKIKHKELYVFGEKALELGFIDELI